MTAVRWLLVFAGGLVAVALGRAGWSVAHGLWLGAAGLSLSFLGVFWWHRRQLAELHEKRNADFGQYRRTGFGAWPKACWWCGSQMPDWKAIRAHDDPHTSACAAFLEHVQRVEGLRGPVGMDWQQYDDAPPATEKDRV